MTKIQYNTAASEYCPHCDCENEFLEWDGKFVKWCQECGRLLMLCDACMHENESGDCDSSICDWVDGGHCFRYWEEKEDISPKLYTFSEHDLSVTGEQHHLIELAELLREADGTLGDLRYQIEYHFDIDGIRTQDIGE